MRDIRDKEASLLAAGNTNSALFHDVEAINDNLNEVRSTVELFKQIEARDPAFAESIYMVAEKPLVASGEYALARKYLGNPEKRFVRAKQLYERGIKHAATQSPTAEMSHRAMENIFAERMIRLIAVLDKTGDKAGAQAIQAKALQVLNNDEIKNAIHH